MATRDRQPGSAQGTPPTPAPCIALVSGSPDVAARLTACLAAVGAVREFQQPEDLRGPHAARSIAVVIVEAAREGDTFLDRVFEAVGQAIPVLLAVPADGPEPARDPRVFYVLRPDLPDVAVVALIRGALRRTAPPTAIPSPADAERLARILSAAAQFVAASDLADAARIAESAIRSFVAADRVLCLFHDPASGTLWSESDETRERAPAAGIAGFAARTGEAVIVERAAADPRYDPRLDDPRGDGDAHLLVIPVGDRDGIHAVFLAARSRPPPFSARERDLLVSFADSAGPMMRHLALLGRVEALLRTQPEYLFRTESMQAHAGSAHGGDIVRISPGWIRWAYWLLVALTTASFAYLFLGEVDQYSTGPAIVRLHERTELAAQIRGPLLAVDVAAGQHVEAGDLLARLDDTALQAELGRVRREFDAQLRKRMLDLSDAAAIQALISLRGQERGVLDRIELHQIRAPHPGTISDLRTRAGQHIEIGDVVLSLIRDDERRRVIALLPGDDRPQLHPGMSLRLELRGYRYAYQDLVIDEVSNEVIGPTEARRFLGPQLADVVTLPGPVVVVQAALPGGTFVADGVTYNYHDGMLAVADVRIRTEPILELFFPALGRL